MKARDLMNANVKTCSKDDSLEQGARVMWESDVGCLVVTDEDQHPIGMITDRDIAMAAYTQGALLRDMRVQMAMAKQVLTCRKDSVLSEVESLMQTAQIRRLPVVGADERLCGIVTLGDLARDAQSGPRRMPAIPGVAKTLAAVSERRPAESAAAAQ